MRGLIAAPRRFFIVGFALMACLGNSNAAAAITDIGTEGWYTWRVAATENAPDWCCYEWNRGVAKNKSCDLDGEQGTFNSHSDLADYVEQMQVYVLLDGGTVQKLRAVSAQCPVRARTEITDLGIVDADESVDWLEKLISPRSNLSAHAMATISVHEGQKSSDVLIEVSRHDAELDNRKDSVFWMSQVRANDTASELKQLMFNDSNPELREHVAFSISQSILPDRADALVQLGRNDKNSDVRSKAWFWLAQTGVAESDIEIQKALRDERNQGVRDELVFALSQLPDDRAFKALIAVIEDRKMSDDDREQALFWLAQSDSDLAFEYLNELISRR
jgi:HEAT repeat protein